MRMLRPFLLPLAAGWGLLLAPVPPSGWTGQDPVATAPGDTRSLDQLLAATSPPTAPRVLLDAIVARKHTGSPDRKVDSSAIAAVLGETEALVEFVQWHAAAGERTTALILRPHREPQRVDLGDAMPLRQAIVTHLQLLARTQRPLDAASLRLADATSRRLGALVLQPLEPLLTGCSRVHMAPHGDLMALPFDSLPTSRTDTLLLESLDVRLLVCGSELLAPPPPAGHDLLVIDGGSFDLPESSREARTIAGLWERAQRGEVVQRSSAQLATLRDDLRGREFVHLAGVPRALTTLTPDERPETPSRPTAAAVDAALRRRIPAALELTDCRLLVVSSSETPLENEATPGATIGRWREALRRAGARSSLLAAWPLEGAATRELLTDFWRELLACDDPSLALRRAKLARLEANRAAHSQTMPGTWAGFQLLLHAAR